MPNTYALSKRVSDYFSAHSHSLKVTVLVAIRELPFEQHEQNYLSN
jgi:hypothetical protein